VQDAFGGAGCVFGGSAAAVWAPTMPMMGMVTAAMAAMIRRTLKLFLAV
jgi:hypothetical protein